MADYNKATNFTAKDGLPTGNPAKIVKGTEIDIELTAVASAVASKADINSPALTGTPTTPTAEAGTNTLQIASTEFVTRALQSAYPIGSIYINASSNASPTVLLGFGTWVAFGAGRVLVGLDSGDALFDTAEETGGSKDAVVVSHTHTATVTDPSHSHPHPTPVPTISGNNYGAPGGASWGNATSTGAAYTSISVSNASTGVSGTNANIQPYITVRMWKRTA